ncbi:hypothetical protein LXA43DRAFT_198948 [Ganoderma leucocontextum]|nr:hypothetical protein LXA43DRAFT_198948 [Ganoderma leucocontextum]
MKVPKQVLETIFGLSMPLLSELDVHASRRSTTHLDLSPEHLPALRSLRLSLLAIKGIPTMLPKLHRLDLAECTCKDSTVTFDQLLDVLAGCVELRELRLHDFLSALRGPSDPETQASTFTTILFRNLRKLTLYDTPRSFLRAARRRHRGHHHRPHPRCHPRHSRCVSLPPPPGYQRSPAPAFGHVRTDRELV